jgi:hypothetical protein
MGGVKKLHPCTGQEEFARTGLYNCLQNFVVIFFHLHCTENLKHILPEMKLCGLVSSFFIHVSGSNLYIPMMSLIWNLYFPVLGERTFGSPAGAERRTGNCC